MAMKEVERGWTWHGEAVKADEKVDFEDDLCGAAFFGLAL